MPNKALVFNLIGIVLQYSLLILIYYFLFRVINLIVKDVRTPENRTSVKPKSSTRTHDDRGKLVVIDRGQVQLERDQFIMGGTLSIGRSEHNEIFVDDAFVSYEHAIINKNKQGYWLTDLNSTNKTYLNNQPVNIETLLKNGDLIKIGAVTFRFEG
ncbi:FHA domain-containing protein [Pelosinus sp. sgz500959]|uniref:FHA domain-containing protein n=1 Tax=Pelosinus sp. sgz500959 TaxID=3242472 RepID=UPI00366BFE05